MMLDKILNHRKSGEAVFYLTRFMPPRFGYFLVRLLSYFVASRKDLPMIKALRVNQWVANDFQLSRDQLDCLVRKSLEGIGLSMFTMFHYWDNNLALQKRIRYCPNTENLIRRSQEKLSGTMVVFIHSSNFDVSLKAASSRGLDGMVLSLPETNDAVEWQHTLRKSSGIEIRPASLAALREASERLKAGCTVATGIDRPMPGSKYQPRFFCRPTPLPTHHIYLALKCEVPVAVVTAFRSKDGFYNVKSSPLIEMQRMNDHQAEVIKNAETILEIAENFIREDTSQWAMLHPLWPEEIPTMPV